MITKSTELHKQLKGKIETVVKTEITKENLPLVYSPGVADPCLAIEKDPSLVKEYCWTQSLVGVISDGSAVLGLGNIGAKASLPVMEGKSALIKQFGDVDSIPIVLETQDTEEIINIIKNISSSFGAINLEDISSPRCIEIETRLQDELDIPVFHDDQHGTAIVSLAGMINALKLVDKKFSEITVVVSGVGAAGNSIIRLLREFGVKDIKAFNSRGNILNPDHRGSNVVSEKLAKFTTGNPSDTLADALVGADAFIGVSVADVVTKNMVETMAYKPIIFALANPNPEIKYDLAKEAGAFIVATGRSDYPNQINNLLAFPAIFKAAFKYDLKQIDMNVKKAVVEAIAETVSNKELSVDYIVPSPFKEGLIDHIVKKVGEYL